MEAGRVVEAELRPRVSNKIWGWLDTWEAHGVAKQSMLTSGSA